MNNTTKYSIIAFSFFLLVLIRVFETKLFYDPFIQFYKTIYFSSKIPDYSFTKIVLFTFLRYLLNSIISIFILFISFKKREITRFSVVFYSLAFIVLIFFYSIVLLNFSYELKQVFFYIRRFLIQPIFILILLPAFYYQNYIANNK